MCRAEAVSKDSFKILAPFDQAVPTPEGYGFLVLAGKSVILAGNQGKISA
jgi:hypothetical protein